MSGKDTSDGWSMLLERLTRQHAGAEFAAIDPGHRSDERAVLELVHSFMVWEAGEQRAEAATPQLLDGFCDVNELRVASPAEVAAAMPARYPKRDERADRLVATLSDLFEREHRLSLGDLAGGGVKRARALVHSLDGVPRFVAARTLLVAAGVSGIPIDGRLLRVLRAGNAATLSDDEQSAAVRLERLVPAAECAEVYAMLEAAAEAESRRTRARGKASR